MSDNKYQREEDLAAYRGVWEQNQRAALELQKRQNALIAEAQAGLKAALEADKKAGLAETAILRTQRPVRDPILDVTPSWEWTPEKRAEFDSKRRIAERAYFEAIVSAEGRLLSDTDRKHLPAAILFFQREQAAQESEGR